MLKFVVCSAITLTFYASRTSRVRARFASPGETESVPTRRGLASSSSMGDRSMSELSNSWLTIGQRELADVTGLIETADDIKVVKCCCDAKQSFKWFDHGDIRSNRCKVYLCEPSCKKCGEYRVPDWASKSMHHFRRTGDICQIAPEEVEPLKASLMSIKRRMVDSNILPMESSFTGSLSQIILPNFRVELKDVTNLIVDADAAGILRCCCDSYAFLISEMGPQAIYHTITNERTQRCQVYTGLTPELKKTCGNFERPDWATGPIHHYTRTTSIGCQVASSEVVQLLSLLGSPADYCTWSNSEAPSMNAGTKEASAILAAAEPVPMPTVHPARLGDFVQPACPKGFKAIGVYCTYESLDKGLFRPAPECVPDEPVAPVDLGTSMQVRMGSWVSEEDDEEFADVFEDVVEKPITLPIPKLPILPEAPMKPEPSTLRRSDTRSHLPADSQTQLQNVRTFWQQRGSSTPKGSGSLKGDRAKVTFEDDLATTSAYTAGETISKCWKDFTKYDKETDAQKVCSLQKGCLGYVMHEDGSYYTLKSGGLTITPGTPSWIKQVFKKVQAVEPPGGSAAPLSSQAAEIPREAESRPISQVPQKTGESESRESSQASSPMDKKAGKQPEPVIAAAEVRPSTVAIDVEGESQPTNVGGEIEPSLAVADDDGLSAAKFADQWPVLPPTTEEYEKFLDVTDLEANLHEIVEIGAKVAANLDQNSWTLSVPHSLRPFLHRPESKLRAKMGLDYYNAPCLSCNSSTKGPLTGLVVAVIGAGPAGLRFGVEAALMGAKVHILERGHTFIRYNVLKLWSFSVEDLVSIGVKDLHPPLVGQSVRRIPIAVLQQALLRINLVLGVQMHLDCGYKGWGRKSDGEVYLVPDPDTQCPTSSDLEKLRPHAIFDATGTKALLREFGAFNDQPLIQTRSLGGSEAIGMTINFKPLASKQLQAFVKRTEKDPRFEKHNPATQDKYDLSKQFARTLFNKKEVLLENWMYWESSTSHYLVLTISREALVKYGVLQRGASKGALNAIFKKCDQDKLRNMVLTIAEEWNIPHMTKEQFGADVDPFISNWRGKPDISIFEFGTAKRAITPAIILPGGGKIRLFGVLGDAMCTPFWPQGTGANRALYSAHLQTLMLMAWLHPDRSAESTCALADEMMKRLLAIPITGNAIGYTPEDYEKMMVANYNFLPNNKIPYFA